MKQIANTFVELGRVYFVNNEKYTIDVLTASGTFLKDVPFLSFYSKPSDKGQGVYAMPEEGSYTMIVRTINVSSGRQRFNREVFAFGFFNPVDENRGFKSSREDLNPGDIALKTAAGNKVLLTTDGVILVHASDLCRMELFPFSGNSKDSAGLDNLLRIFLENFRLYSNGGNWQWSTDKKAPGTNFIFEFKNKPLLEHNPSYIRGMIGSQGPTGNPEYFKTYEHIISEANGKVEKTLIRHQEKITGEFERKHYTESGELTYELNFKPDGSYDETQYEGGVPVWYKEREPNGTLHLQLPKGGDKIKLTVTSDGQITLETDLNINIKSKNGQINVQALSEINVISEAPVTVKGETIIADSSSVLLGTGASEPVPLGNQLKSWLDNHTHIDSDGGSTSAPTSQFNGLSSVVKTA